MERFLPSLQKMRVYFIILLFLPILSRAQNYFESHFGGTIGLVLNFGTHNNNIGINLKGYYTDYFFQANLGSSVTFNINSYGKRKMFWENKNTLGLILLADKNDNTAQIDFQLDGLNHQTTNNYGIGYNYIFYFDNRGTSQQSGGFAIHLKNFSIYHENDVFGGQGKDRFRTGHLLFSYRYADFKFGLGLNLWTGETAKSPWNKEAKSKMPSGYRDLTKSAYGATSHGILYGSMSYYLDYGQYLTAKIGIDSEQIRHTIQNRLMHDLIFLPKKVKRKTPHYPRLDEKGKPIFSKDEMRRNLLFMQIGANSDWSN